MDHFRLRKYRGPETWRQVRLAYEAGEPGPSVARRFDVGLSNLRKKARQEGWDRRSLAEAADLKPVRGAPDDPAPAVGPLAATPAHPEVSGPAPDPALDPSPDPMEAAMAARDEAARRAARRDGRGAMELIKAADALIDSVAAVTALRCDMNKQDREQLANERRRLAQDEAYLHAAEHRRQFEREAELREAEHQAQLARLRRPQPPEAEPPPVAETPSGEADGAPELVRTKPKKSFEERVREASGKSGPETRRTLW